MEIKLIIEVLKCKKVKNVMLVFGRGAIWKLEKASLKPKQPFANKTADQGDRFFPG